MADIKKIRGHKIKVVKLEKDDFANIEVEEVIEDDSNLSDEIEKKIDKEIEHENDLSITVIISILVLCFFVGISLGYMLYRIAINSSNAMMIIKYFLNWQICVNNEK